MQRRARIAICTVYGGSDWAWITPHFRSEPVDWEFFLARPPTWLQRRLRSAHLTVMRTAWSCVNALACGKYDLLITLDPGSAHWCARFCAQRKIQIPHVSLGYNLGELPTGWKLRMTRNAARLVDRIVVSTTLEQELYPLQLGLPSQRFELQLWCMGIPSVADPTPLLPPGTENYICSMGTVRRDYRTLIEAMRKLPHIPCVVLAWPYVMAGIDVPANVTVRSGVPFPQAMGLLQRSRFMVLPMVHGSTPAGHGTVVNAMHLAKATLITRSVGMSDYVKDGITGMVCDAGSPQAMATAIAAMWDAPELADRIGNNARAFALERCTEEALAEYVRGVLRSYGLLKESSLSSC